MRRSLIIGIGNPLRGDDGLGWHVIERLRGTAAGARADLLACHQLTPELAGPMARSDRVIFIDAAEGEPAGEIRLERIRGDKPGPSAFSHHLDPAAVAEYASALYGASPEVAILSVKGAAYGFSEDLSGPVLGAVPEVLRLVQDLLAADPQPLPTDMEGTWLPALNPSSPF